MQFAGLELKTTKDTLIPRPETELLVKACLDTMQGRPAHILEIGTGSGNIAVSLTSKNRDCKITTLDISGKALEIAQENAVRHGVQHRIEFIKSDLFSNLEKSCPNNYDIIISNPPYIASWEIETLATHVKEEPRIALDGGQDGLDFYKKIIRECAPYIKNNGHLIMEIGYGQSHKIKKILEQAGNFADIEIIKDISGIDRVVKARWIN